MPKKKPSGVPRFTAAQAVRDIVVAAINKGQFLLFLLFLLLFALIIKMPAEQAGVLFIALEQDLRDFHLLGWIMEGITVAGWVVLNRRQRKTYRNEINRLSSEKNAAQTEQLGDLVKSSRSRS